MMGVLHFLSNSILATSLAVQIIYLELDRNMQFLAPRKTLQMFARRLERGVVGERAI